jgi:hypothetical protein
MSALSALAFAMLWLVLIVALAFAVIAFGCALLGTRGAGGER